MKQRILIFIIAASLAGAAGFFILSNQGQTGAQPQVPATPASAQPPVDLEALKAKAQSGDPAAQTSLGWIYEKGAGVKTNMKEAVKWFKQAADQNDPDALDALGEMTQAGQGVTLDVAEAARLYQLAAEKGNVAAQYNLAYLYEQGSGVDKNETQAAKWYQLAAEGGDPIAQYDIGQRYMLGVGVSTDRVQAFKWLTLAAGQGQVDAGHLLPGLKSQMSSQALAEAGRLAKEFVPRGSNSPAIKPSLN
jgi:hypothetical protein